MKIWNSSYFWKIKHVHKLHRDHTCINICQWHRAGCQSYNHELNKGQRAGCLSYYTREPNEGGRNLGNGCCADGEKQSMYNTTMNIANDKSQIPLEWSIVSVVNYIDQLDNWLYKLFFYKAKS